CYFPNLHHLRKQDWLLSLPHCGSAYNCSPVCQVGHLPPFTSSSKTVGSTLNSCASCFTIASSGGLIILVSFLMMCRLIILPFLSTSSIMVSVRSDSLDVSNQAASTLRAVRLTITTAAVVNISLCLL